MPSDEEIGEGRSFLNDYLSGKFNDKTGSMQDALLQFLKSRVLEGRSILLDENVVAVLPELKKSLERAIEFLATVPKETSLTSLQSSLKQWGILPGVGDSSSRMKINLELLRKILDAPDPSDLEKFMSALPLVSRVAVISPHGWFGQEKVLGRPDTGGQIVYILDQVKALEKFLETMLKTAGVDATPKILVLTRLIPENDGTSCDERLEKIHSTNNSWILRIPLKMRRESQCLTGYRVFIYGPTSSNSLWTGRRSSLRSLMADLT